MKKFLHRNKYFMALAAIAVMAVGCGLEISSVVLDNKTPVQGETITLTASLVPTDQNQKHEHYQMLGVRVPSDWASDQIVVKGGADASSLAEIAVKECDAYAKFLNILFPREGYKWIGFQSKNKGEQSDNYVVDLKLQVGQNVGKYDLDVVSGMWRYEASYLFDANGGLIYDQAFGHNMDGTGSVKDDGPDGKYHSSEQLLNAATITPEEIAAANASLEPIKINVYDAGERGVVVDIPNKNTMQVDVEVKAGAGIEGVAADAANGPVEWFTLQGVRVERPAAGNVYIRRQGGDVSKVYVK